MYFSLKEVMLGHPFKCSSIINKSKHYKLNYSVPFTIQSYIIQFISLILQITFIIQQSKKVATSSINNSTKLIYFQQYYKILALMKND